MFIVALLFAISYAQTDHAAEGKKVDRVVNLLRANVRTILELESKDNLILKDGYIFPKSSSKNPIPMTWEVLQGTSLEPLPADMIGTLYWILNVTNTIMTRLNVTYWLADGALLGYERHNGSLIPWTDDVDIYALLSDVSKNGIEVMKLDFAKYNMKMIKTYFGYRVCSPISLFGTYVNDCALPFLDIYDVVEDSKSGKIKGDFSIYRNEVFPLQEQVQFGAARVNIPHKPVPYLKRAYGNDCFICADLQSIHTSGFYELAPLVKVYFSSWLVPKYHIPDQLKMIQAESYHA